MTSPTLLRLVLIATCVAAGSAPLDGQTRHELTELHMGMPVRLVLYAADSATAETAATAAYARIAELEDRMSDYRPASDVRQLEQRPGEWVTVHPDLFAVLETALAIAEASEGAFDPTLGPLVALWREARRTGALPPTAQTDSARALTGWRKIEMDQARSAVRLADHGMRIDLGGIAKGFILGEALAVLRSRGVSSALLEAGGDIVLGDPPPGRPGWSIEAPYTDPAVAARVSTLANTALATSGPTAQFVVIDGVQYSHVLDPRTGAGLTTDVVATVIAPDAAIADGLATALTVLGPERAAELLDRFPGVVASVRSAEPGPSRE